MDCFTKIVHYKLVQTMIHMIDLVNIIINIVIRYYNLFELIISD